MGDRISIQFANGSEKSVALFSHWDGRSFLKVVNSYLKEYRKTHKKGAQMMPLDRFEPNTVMLDFIRYLATTNYLPKTIESNYYLGKDEDDGDNSDNGNFVIDREWAPKNLMD